MSSYLMINGKKLELTDEQVKILSEEPKKDVWRKPRIGETYWYITTDGQVKPIEWDECGWDFPRFRNGNCCLEEKPLEKEKLNIILYQRLQRFSYQHGWDEGIWEDSTEEKWYLWYDTDNEIWKVDWTFCCYEPMQVYFMSKEIAKQANEEIIKPFCEGFSEYLGGVSK